MNRKSSQFTEQACAASDFVRRRSNLQPEIAVILGTGLGDFVEELDIETVLSFKDVPGLQQPTATGHPGRLLTGTVSKIPVLVLQGRSHCYEGYSRQKIVYPIEMLKTLGIRKLLISCAAGGLNPAFCEGDLMLIDDHVDFLPTRLTNNDFRAQREFTDTYDQTLRTLALRAALQSDIALQRGVYVAVTGPNYETRAEMRFFRRFADAIGMSTVPEATSAVESGMQVLGLVAITNICRPDSVTVADGEHVVQSAQAIAPKFRKLVTQLIRHLPDCTM